MRLLLDQRVQLFFQAHGAAARFCLGCILCLRQRDARAFDIARQRHRLAEQARCLAAAIAQFARQNRLGICHAGPHQRLGGQEHVLHQFGAAGDLGGEQREIGRKLVRKPGRRGGVARARLHNLAVQCDCLFGLAAPREKGAEPRARAVHRAGFGILRGDQLQRGR